LQQIKFVLYNKTEHYTVVVVVVVVVVAKSATPTSNSLLSV